ncbi:hypothetical protein CcaverHIS631_0607060 [Cutaneotrichosporon cavernicola]|nr:hypothetical protein CcaverHIS631_0607060 [Cutaneotrichosporon cavernicola]BEJ09786.1 hypothetical protein CcaverHIS641_0607010 [Cutaneotrichosporon cavernicola]
MCFFRSKEPKQMQSVAKALYKPSTIPRAPVMEDYNPASNGSKPRLAPPRASTGGNSVSSERTSVAEAEREVQQAELRALVTQRHNNAPDSPFVFPALAPWIEAAEFAAFLQQDALVEAGDELGEHNFEVDMEADNFAPTDEDISSLAHQIGAAAVGILQRGPYYSAPNGSSRVLFILDAPLPPLTLATAGIKAPRILASGSIHNVRRAVEGLASMMKWRTSPVEQGRGIELNDGTSTATVMFDELGRWTGFSASLSGQAA